MSVTVEINLSADGSCVRIALRQHDGQWMYADVEPQMAKDIAADLMRRAGAVQRIQVVAR